MGYETDTRSAYNAKKAEGYKAAQTRGISWIRFTTWREKCHVARALTSCQLKKGDRVLDIPCGTGILGSIFARYPVFVFGSDISSDMITLAFKEYDRSHFAGFVRADITQVPFRKTSFSCVITLGLMHRLPQEIREQALREITMLTERYAVVSFSMDNATQRVKKWIMKGLHPSYQSAPSPARIEQVKKELAACGMKLRKRLRIMPFLSAETVMLLEKENLQKAS